MIIRIVIIRIVIIIFMSTDGILPLPQSHERIDGVQLHLWSLGSVYEREFKL